MITLTIRPLTSGNVAIGDGTSLLDACPCCGKPLTAAAAEAVTKTIISGKLSFQRARELVELLRTLEVASTSCVTTAFERTSPSPERCASSIAFTNAVMPANVSGCMKHRIPQNGTRPLLNARDQNVNGC